jgi:hypothetical protein
MDEPDMSMTMPDSSGQADILLVLAAKADTMVLNSPYPLQSSK